MDVYKRDSEMIIYKYVSIGLHFGSGNTQFISTGEGRELTRLENLHIRTKYPKVEQWYKSLDEDRRERVDRFLGEMYDT